MKYIVYEITAHRALTLTLGEYIPRKFKFLSLRVTCVRRPRYTYMTNNALQPKADPEEARWCTASQYDRRLGAGELEVRSLFKQLHPSAITTPVMTSSWVFGWLFATIGVHKTGAIA